jgi:hypothetical protein
MTDPLPRFTVDNEPSDELGRDCLRIDIRDRPGAARTMRAGFVEGQTIELGDPIRVSIDTSTHRRTIFDGAISAIQFVFDENGPPTVTVSAVDAVFDRPPNVASYTLVRGHELLSARVMVSKAQQFVSVTGITSGWPNVDIGTILRLEHIGASFSGDGYRVTRINHTFDLEDGLRSSFAAQRAF